MPEEKKQRLKEYQKNYYKTKKSQYNNEENIFLIVILIILIVTNKIVFWLRFNNACYLFIYLFGCSLLNLYIYVILDRLTEIKA